MTSSSNPFATRTLTLSEAQNDGSAVVYVMSREQRARDNHALLAAQHDANNRKLPLVVLFNLYTRAGHRTREQYEFMLAGLDSVSQDLHQKNIPFIIRMGDPYRSTIDLLNDISAASVYFDFSPLQGPRRLAKRVAKQFDGSAYVIDTHNIIPAWVTSDKQEFAARTIRRKIHKNLEKYISDPPALQKHRYSITAAPASASKKDIDALLETLPKSGATLHFNTGEVAALRHVKAFIKDGLKTYAHDRNDASIDALSNFSPYLHFGQISSLRITLLVLDTVDQPPLLFQQARMPQPGDVPSIHDGADALFEEMIVRKELSDNFCLYASSYTTISGAPEWGVKTLASHADDTRDFTYTQSDWEKAQTHDDAWNAAQNQMMRTGKMHGYMRMYWAKKLLEWSSSPEQAIRTAVYLNDKYSIDGGDPNGYVGILWSITGLHDRPWTERSVFGQVRYMNSAGLKRKFDINRYIETWT